jgi:hypothetical protein
LLLPSTVNSAPPAGFGFGVGGCAARRSGWHGCRRQSRHASGLHPASIGACIGVLAGVPGTQQGGFAQLERGSAAMAPVCNARVGDMIFFISMLSQQCREHCANCETVEL